MPQEVYFSTDVEADGLDLRPAFYAQLRLRGMHGRQSAGRHVLRQRNMVREATCFARQQIALVMIANVHNVQDNLCPEDMHDIPQSAL